MTDNTTRRHILWTSSAQTDIGTVRDVNEDAILAKSEVGLWAVADGMGGHHFGDVASSKIVAALDSIEHNENLSEFLDAVEDAVLNANNEMIEYAQIMFDGGSMGSTFVSLIIRDRIGICLWVGDSRLYRFRNQQLVQLSRDHSQVEEMIANGLISEADVDNHPSRNVITRAVGVEESLFVDINVFTVQVGDTYLLCSDGLYNAVEKTMIQQTLSVRDPNECVESLISQAIANGARDNVSVIVVKGNLEKLSSAKPVEA